MTSDLVIQTLMGMLGSVGFAILFNIRGKKLVIAGLGGGVTWAAYLWAYAIFADKGAGVFIATLVAAVASEILARIIKTPVIILLVPMLIPLIPGGDLYYAMHHFVYGNMTQFQVYSNLLLKEVAAISFGIIAIGSGAQLINRAWRFIKKHG